MSVFWEVSDSQWEMELFDNSGNTLAAIPGAINRVMTFKLNDVDQLTFSLYLDDPVAALVVPLRTVVKVWRHQRGRAGHDPLPRSTPSFCGVVSGRTRTAATNLMDVTVMSPLWRLQHRYHIDPHDYSVTTGTGQVFLWPGAAPDDPVHPGEVWGRDPVDIIRTMIGFTNALIGHTLADETGILIDGAEVPDRFSMGGDAANPPIAVESRFDRGQLSWDMVQGFVQIPGFCEIAPRYTHVDGHYGMMYLDLPAVRGVRLDSPTLRYDAGATSEGGDPLPSNLDDVTEIESADPGSFADYIVVQNQGDTNAGQTIIKADGTTIPIPNNPGSSIVTEDLINELGLYMYFEKLDQPSTQSDRISFALDLLARMQEPTVVLQPVVSPTATDSLGFQRDDGFDVGDTITINVVKNSMIIIDARKRIGEVSVTISENNMEMLTLTLIDDKLDIVKTEPTPTFPDNEHILGTTTPTISGGTVVGDTLTATIRTVTV